MSYSMETASETPSIETIESKEVNTRSIRPDVTLDVSGLMCPLPGLKTFKKVAELTPCQILEVKSTNSILKKFAPMMIKKSSHQWLGFEQSEKDGYYRFYLKKA